MDIFVGCLAVVMTLITVSFVILIVTYEAVSPKANKKVQDEAEIFKREGFARVSSGRFGESLAECLICHAVVPLRAYKEHATYHREIK